MSQNEVRITFNTAKPRHSSRGACSLQAIYSVNLTADHVICSKLLQYSGDRNSLFAAFCSRSCRTHWWNVEVASHQKILKNTSFGTQKNAGLRTIFCLGAFLSKLGPTIKAWNFGLSTIILVSAVLQQGWSLNEISVLLQAAQDFVFKYMYDGNTTKPFCHCYLQM